MMAKRMYTEIRVHHKTTAEKEQFERQLNEKMKAAGFSSRAEYIRVIALKSNILVKEEDTEMKKMIIWADQQDRKYYFKADDIETVIDFSHQCVYKLDGIPVSELEKLNATLKNVDENPTDEYELEEFLKRFEYNKFKISVLPDIADYDEENPFICYDCTYEYEFFDITDCETTEIYKWWDGSNWQTVFKDDFDWHTEVIIDENTERCLDKWDGSNWYTGSRFEHQYVYDVLEINGEKPEEPTYLVKFTSQWIDSHPSAEIMTEDEFREHLEELGRDEKEYIPAK
jgi:hypothetical protein